MRCLSGLLQGGFSGADGDYDLNDSGSWMTKFRTLKPEKNRRKEEKKFKDGERRRQKEEVWTKNFSVYIDVNHVKH